MQKKRITLIIRSDAIEMPDEFPEMRSFVGDFYEKLSDMGIDLKEGLKELPIRERAMNLFLCG